MILLIQFNERIYKEIGIQNRGLGIAMSNFADTKLGWYYLNITKIQKYCKIATIKSAE